jgi:tetratricopeptide (TPR) repeat protein
MLTLAATGVATAQPTVDDRGRALELFKASDQHYRQGEFEQAAQLLRQSYDMYPEPLVLYNLGRALEGMGDLEGAVAEYERYLTTATDIRDRGAIERRITTLKQQLEAKRATPPETPPVEPITAPPVVQVPADVMPPPRRRSVLPWVIVGGGVGVVAVGGVLGVMSDSAHRQAVDEPIQAEAGRLQDRAKTLATAANILFVAGGAIAIGGAVWGIVELRRGRRAEPRRAGTARLQIAPAYVGIEWTLP